MVYYYEPNFACSHCDYKDHRKHSLEKKNPWFEKINVFFLSSK